MLHNDKDNFLAVLEGTAAHTGFPLLLLEKDYYLTIILSGINSLSESLIFKGGTCLNKIYYSYYRLSEDLDFTMILPSDNPSRTVKRKTIKPVKENLASYIQPYGMTVNDIENSGHNESSQYIFYIEYESIILNSQQSIKLEIGLRFNPILPVSNQKIKHEFLHPFTQEPLYEGGNVNCLALKELVAEKMRATATRLAIAPRDFYDLGFLVKSKYDFNDSELQNIFKIKLSEDGFDSDLTKYKLNLGRSEKEISEMSSRIETELLDVLSSEERNAFDLMTTLELLNKTFRNLK